MTPDSDLIQDPGLAINFGRNGSAAQFQGRGWSAGENGYTWAIGTESDLSLPAINCPDGLYVELQCSAFVKPPKFPTQRLRLTINGAEVADTTLASEGIFAWCGPPIVGPVFIRIEHPDARRPRDTCGTGDDRLLAFACRRLRLIPADNTPLDFVPTAFSFRDLASRFCSLGEDCEFGQAQRRLGVEPIDLFRWANIAPEILLQVLNADFSGLADVDQFEVSGGDPEYMIRHKLFGLVWHTYTSASQLDVAGLLLRESRRLPSLIGKLIQELREGGRIFVVKANDISLELEQALLAAVRRFGTGTLLIVRPGPGLTIGHPGAGLIAATLPRFADRNDIPGTTDREAWRVVCGKTLVLADQRACNESRVGVPTGSGRPQPVNAAVTTIKDIATMS
jgi:hypothetical protein